MKRGERAGPDVEEEFWSRPLVRTWLDSGRSREDIRTAQRRLSEQGFTGTALTDLNLIEPLLPLRDVSAMFVEKMDLPEQVPANQPVSFSVDGFLPDLSYSFSQWRISVTGAAVYVEGLADRTGEAGAAMILRTNVTGVIPPLTRGSYTVYFKQNEGQYAEHELVVQ